MATPMNSIERGLLRSIEALEKKVETLTERVDELTEQVDRIYEEKRQKADSEFKADGNSWLYGADD